MRKSVIISLLLVLAVSAGAYVYVYRPFSQASSIESRLPGDTLAMIRICNLNKQISRFSQGRLGQSLAGIDWPRLMNLMGIDEVSQAQFLTTISKAKALVQSPMVDALIGQDLTVAVFKSTVDPELVTTGDMKNLLDSLVMVCRPKHPAAIIEQVTNLLGTQLNEEVFPYKQWKVVKITMGPGIGFYYALDGDLMIAGFSAVTVQRCLDQTEDESSSLKEAPLFKAHAGRMYVDGKTDGMVFIDTRSLYSMLKDIVDREAENDPELIPLKDQIENMQGIDSLNLVQYDDGGPVVNSKVIVGIDRDRLSPMARQAMAIDPSDNTHLSSVPADSLLYSWQNNFDLSGFWNQIQQNPELKPEDIEHFKQMFALQTGMDVDSFLALFGNEFGLLLNDVKTGPMFPIPVVALFFEVKNPEEIEGLITRMTDRYNITVVADQHKGRDIRQLVLPLGDDISPAFSFSGDFMTLTVNRSLLETIVDTPSSQCIGTHPNFMALGDDLSTKNNQMFFIQTQDLLKKSKNLMAWGMTMIAIAKPEEAQKVSEFVEVGVYPLMDGLSMFKAVGGRVVTQETAVLSDMRILMDRG